MKFSKEEISLCKQVAKKHRKRIDDGDWYLRYDHDEPDVYLEGMDDDKAVAKSIPLWTISDCLEFLRERGWLLSSFSEGWKPRKFRFALSPNYEGGCGETPLEACLRAVLAVLEERGNNSVG